MVSRDLFIDEAHMALDIFPFFPCMPALGDNKVRDVHQAQMPQPLGFGPLGVWVVCERELVAFRSSLAITL